VSARGFVVFAADGAEIDWLDPYVSHVEEHPGVFLVTLNVHGLDRRYQAIVPSGGRYEIRELES
jgi:hypothetical protein